MSEERQGPARLHPGNTTDSLKFSQNTSTGNMEKSSENEFRNKRVIREEIRKLIFYKYVLVRFMKYFSNNKIIYINLQEILRIKE